MEPGQSVADSLEKAWSQALVAVSAVEDEAIRWVRRWSEAAGWGPDELRRQAREWADRLAGHRREMEQFVEDGVRRALAHTRLPKREEIEALDRRLGRLAERVQALGKRP